MREMPASLVRHAPFCERALRAFRNSLRHAVKRDYQAVSSAKAILPWRDQLALEPAHCLIGLHGVTELHCCLEDM